MNGRSRPRRRSPRRQRLPAPSFPVGISTRRTAPLLADAASCAHRRPSGRHPPPSPQPLVALSDQRRESATNTATTATIRPNSMPMRPIPIATSPSSYPLLPRTAHTTPAHAPSRPPLRTNDPPSDGCHLTRLPSHPAALTVSGWPVTARQYLCTVVPTLAATRARSIAFPQPDNGSEASTSWMGGRGAASRTAGTPSRRPAAHHRYRRHRRRSGRLRHRGRPGANLGGKSSAAICRRTHLAHSVIAQPSSTTSRP